MGNSLEVIEAIKFLQGEMPDDLKQVVLTLGAYMIKLSGLGEDLENNKNKMLENIENGKAYDKFKQLIEAQGADASYIEDVESIPKANFIEPIYSKMNGYIYEINSKEIGKLASYLGAGREKKEDSIDYQVGIILNKKVSDKVKEDDVIAYIHANNIEKLNYAKEQLENIIKISKNPIQKEKIILEIIE